MPFIGIYKNLFPSSNEPEEKKEIIHVTVLPLNDLEAKFAISSISIQKAVDDKGNTYDIIGPTYNSFSWKTFKHSMKFKFNIDERYIAEVNRLYDKKSYHGTIGNIQLIRINLFGSRKYL